MTGIAGEYAIRPGRCGSMIGNDYRGGRIRDSPLRHCSSLPAY